MHYQPYKNAPIEQLIPGSVVPLAMFFLFLCPTTLEPYLSKHPSQDNSVWSLPMTLVVKCSNNDNYDSCLVIGEDGGDYVL